MKPVHFLMGAVMLIMMGCKPRTEETPAPVPHTFEAKVEDKTLTLYDWTNATSEQKQNFARLLIASVLGVAEESRVAELMTYFDLMAARHSANLSEDLSKTMLTATKLYSLTEAAAKELNWPLPAKTPEPES